MSTDASATVQLVFAGEVLEGFSTDDVKLRVAQVLKLDDAKLHRMFSGKRVVIKRDVAAADADRWVAKFRAMGARLHIVAAAQASSAPAPAPAASARPALSPEPTAAEFARASRSKRLPKPIGLYAGGALVALVVVLGVVYQWPGPDRTQPGRQAPVPPGKVVDASAIPLPPDRQLVSKLGSDAAAAEFHSYMSASKSRAFAISFGSSAWGWNAGAAAPEQAIEQAIADCDKRRQAGTPECYLVHVDDQWATD